MKPDGTIAKVLVTGMLGLGFVGAGCHSSSDGQGKLLASGTAAGINSGGLGVLPPGMLPPGLGGSPALLEGPQVDIVSPARASHTTSRRIAVEGVVTDLGGGVADVRVQGRKVTLDSAGAFREEVDLEVGMNTIEVEAFDRANHRRSRFVNVVAGDLAPEGEALPSVATFRLTDGALDIMEPQIVAGIEAQRPQIIAQALATPVQNDTKVTGFNFGAVNAGVDLVPGGMRFQATIQNVAMDIEHKAKFLLVFSTTKRGTVRASSVVIDGVAQVSATNGQVSVNVVQIGATANGFSVPDWVPGSETANVKRALENGFAASASRAFGQGLADAFKDTSGTSSSGQPGAGLDVEWKLSTLQCDATGANMMFSANAKPQAAASVGAETRSVVTRTGASNLTGGSTGGPNVAMALHQDLVNRVLHAAWRGGALKQTIDQAALVRLDPNTTTRLDTTALMAMAPELAAVLQPGIPIELIVEGELPSVMTFRASPLPHLLDVGGLKVTTVIVDPSKGRTVLGEASYSIRAEVTFVEKAGKLVIQPAGQTTVLVDSLGQAQPGAELVLEKMARTMGPQLLGMALGRQDGFALPPVKGMTVTNLSLQHLDGNVVGIGTAVKANP